MPDIFRRFERNPIRPDPQVVKYANAPQTPVYDPKYAAGPRMSVGTIGDVQLAINATSNGTDYGGRATPENKSLFEPYRNQT